LLAPPDFSDYLVSSIRLVQKGEVMAEKKVNTKDGTVVGSTRTSTAKNKKEQTLVKSKAIPRASKKQRVAGKAEESAHTSKLISFSFEAPQASNVSLVGCFNGWNPQATRLKQNPEGVWTCVVSIEPGEHQYRFIVDEEWRNDPLNAKRCSNEFGTENCVLIVEE
jgi:1,4-alpha-glucan branching enzyme